jgi:hypothetical protein
MEVLRLPKGANVLRRSEYAPTDNAPASGRYELMNIFGTPTHEAVSASAGERLPAAPLGYSWRLIAEDEPLEVARRRVLEAEKLITRQEALVQQMECRGNAEIAKIGRSLLHAFSRFTSSCACLCQTPQGVSALISPFYRRPPAVAAGGAASSSGGVWLPNKWRPRRLLIASAT